jgi:hypothetical protein
MKKAQKSLSRKKKAKAKLAKKHLKIRNKKD